MVASLKLKGLYNVKINESNQIMVNGNILSLKEIPFIRYDLGTYNDEAVQYIKDSMTKFSKSTHLIQYNVDENLLNYLEKTDEFSGKTAKYIYFTITQEDMLNGKLNDSDIQIATEAVTKYNIDRIMIIDKTINMDMANAKKIITDTSKKLGVKISNIGICSSPLCMTDELACLTALKARELAALYSNSSDVALPSANHQCLNCCGCMRFFDVTNDCIAPEDTKAKKKSTSNTNNSSKTKKQKKFIDSSAFTLTGL